MPHLRVHPDALAVEKAEHAPPAKPTPRPEVRKYISVLVAINLKAGSGKIQFTAPLPEPGVEAGRKDQRAQIRVVHASGPPSDYPVTVPTSSGRLSEEGKTDWATATVPYSPDLKGVELVVAGQVVDQRLVSRHPPVLENIRLSSAPEKGEYTKEALGQVSFEWDARDMDGDPLSYTVQVSRDQGKSWQTVGILSHPNLDLPLERLKGSSTVMLRVLASDGFNITTLTSETFDLSKSHEVLPKKGTPGGKTGD